MPYALGIDFGAFHGYIYTVLSRLAPFAVRSFADRGKSVSLIHQCSSVRISWQLTTSWVQRSVQVWPKRGQRIARSSAQRDAPDGRNVVADQRCADRQHPKAEPGQKARRATADQRASQGDTNPFRLELHHPEV